MRYPTLKAALVLGLAALTGCEAATAPDAGSGPEPLEPVELGPAEYNSEIILGRQTALTTSAQDMWPQLEGDRVAWYRARPSDEEGLWVLDVSTGESTRVWAGTIRSTFDLSDGQVFWGGPDALYRYDIASGVLTTLDDGLSDYRDVTVTPSWIIGTASDNAARPFYLDRATGELTLLPTPSRASGTRGWGDYLVWSDFRSSAGAEFRMLEISSGTEEVITSTGQFLDARNAAFDGGVFVYSPRQFCSPSLMAYTLADGTTSPVDPGGLSCPKVADMEEGILVWYELRGGGVTGVGFMDLASGDAESVELPNTGTGRIDADLDGPRVVHSSADGLVLLELTDPPEPPFASAGGPYEVLEGSTLVLDASASFANEGGTLSYRWDMGDGTVIDGPVSPEHVWVDDGEYTVTLTVTETVAGAEPLSSTAETAVTVTNQAPLVFLPEALSVEAGGQAAVESSFSDAGAADGPWSWVLTVAGREAASGRADNQGSLESGTLTAPTEAGDYPVVLTVTDKDGATGAAELLLTVTAPARTLPEALRITVGNGEKNSVPAAGSNGVFPVVVHGLEGFPVDALDLDAFRFGPAGARPLEGDEHGPGTADVDDDGLPDLVLRFRMRQTGLTGSETSVCLQAETREGDALEGCGPVRIAGGEKGKDKDRGEDKGKDGEKGRNGNGGR